MRGADVEPGASRGGRARPSGPPVAVATAASLVALACALGWYRSESAPPALDDLTLEQRRALVTDLLEVSPGVFQRAVYAPEIGYTLVPGKEVEAWKDRFTSNALGYRTGPPEKGPDVFRIVLVGDSWTYGMGVREEETFAHLVEELANEHAGVDRRVECWTLALPGYNLHNGLAALDFFRERLRPDHVVVVPGSNDVESSGTVGADGAHLVTGTGPDELGDPHPVAYHAFHVNSHRYHERWRLAMERLRASEERLLAQGIGVTLFFLARWRTEEAHAHVARAGLESPYVVVPGEYTHGEWVRGALEHGNARAHRLYARVLYAALAGRLGWGPLPADPELSPLADPVPVLAAPPEGVDWVERYRRTCAEDSARLRPTWRPNGKRTQVAGPSDPTNGLMGRATTILVRPRAEHRRVEVTVRRLRDAPSLHPLELEVRIPAPGGGSRARLVVPRDGAELQRAELPIPTDLAAGAVLDVVLVADRVVASPDVLAGRSLELVEVRCLP